LLTRPAGSPFPPADAVPLFAALELANSLALGAGVAYVLSSPPRGATTAPATPTSARAAPLSPGPITSS
jgi:hypothetical protein